MRETEDRRHSCIYIDIHSKFPMSDGIEEILGLAETYEVDFYLSALACSSRCVRKQTVVLPFPPVFHTPPKGRDYESLHRSIQDLPPVERLSTTPLRRQQVDLLRWLISHKRRKRLTPVSVLELRGVVPNIFFSAVAANKSLCPDIVFRVIEDGGRSRDLEKEEIIVFHGTCFENVFSILHNGLINHSGESSRLERNGSMYGHGIYCTTDLSVAYAFTSGGTIGWDHSSLGTSLRCILVCTVEPDPTDIKKDKYIVVRRSDKISIKYLLVYVDTVSDASMNTSRAALLMCILVLFLACLIAYKK